MRKSLGMRLYQQCVSLIPRPSVLHCCEIELKISWVSILQSCFSLHISGILSDSMHTRSTVYQDCIKAMYCLLVYQQCKQFFHFSTYSWRRWCHTKKFCGAMYGQEAIFSNAQYQVSFILHSARTTHKFLCIYYTSRILLELYAGSWQFLHL